MQIDYAPAPNERKLSEVDLNGTGDFILTRLVLSPDIRFGKALLK